MLYLQTVLFISIGQQSLKYLLCASFHVKDQGDGVGGMYTVHTEGGLPSYREMAMLRKSGSALPQSENTETATAGTAEVQRANGTNVVRD